MEPLTMAVIGAAATSVVSGLMQAREAAKARGAAQTEINRIDDMLSKVQDPQFDLTEIKPEEFKVMGKYNPTLVQFFEEARPGLVEGKAPEALEGLQAQQSALRRLIEVGRRGEDLQADILASRAAQQAATKARGTIGAIEQQAAQRGMRGGGTQLAQSLLAAQGAQQTGALASQEAAIEAARRKLQAMRDAASLGGDIRGQALDIESRNVDIMNAYNQRYAERKQDWAQQQANVTNEAQLKNLQAAQDAADANVRVRNEAAIRERDLRNKIAQQEYDNTMDRIRARAGVAEDKASQAIGAGRDRTSVIQGVSEGIQTGIQYGASKLGKKEAPKPRELTPEEEWDLDRKRKFGLTV